jgi:hypothetical protein
VTDGRPISLHSFLFIRGELKRTCWLPAWSSKSEQNGRWSRSTSQDGQAMQSRIAGTRNCGGGPGANGVNQMFPTYDRSQIIKELMI